MSELQPQLAGQPASPFALDGLVPRSRWLAGVSFGDGLKQSIILLQREFRWLFFLFFIGGTGLALSLLPVNSTIDAISALIAQELLVFPPNFDLLFSLLTANLLWSLLQTFFTFFVVFLLNASAIHRVLQQEEQLKSLAKLYSAPHLSISRILAAGLITAVFLALANLVLVATPFVLVLLFFVPAVLVIEGKSINRAFSQSVAMRRQYWQRIFAAILFGATLLVFAHTLGVHVYLTIDYLSQVFGVSLGIFGPVLLIVLTQIPVSIVAPLIPFLSLALYSGARGTVVEHQHIRFMKSLSQQLGSTPKLIPLGGDTSVCKNCSAPLRPGSAFCARCGMAIKPLSETYPASKR